MTWFFFQMPQPPDQGRHIENDENKVNGDEVGNEVDVKHRYHGAQIEIKTDREQQADRVGGRQPKIPQTVMKMECVFGERADAFEDSAGKCEGGVQDRDQQSDDGDQVVNLVGVSLIQRQKSDQGHQKTEGQTAGIAQYDFGRREIEKKESQRASRQNDRKERSPEDISFQIYENQGQAGEENHAAGQAVHAVDQVDGIGDPHDPEYCQDDGELMQFQKTANALDLKPGEIEDDGDQALRRQLEFRGAVIDVVINSQDEHQAHSQRQHQKKSAVFFGDRSQEIKPPQGA
jgi:hypothetical protein